MDVKWLIKREEQRKLLVLEMDYLRKSVSRLQKIPITKVNSKMQAKQSILDNSKKAIEKLWSPP